MSTTEAATTASATPTTGGVEAPASRRGKVRPASFLDVAKSEATKLRTVPSTWITLAVAAVLSVGISALACAVTASRYSSSRLDRTRFDPTSVSLAGNNLAQVALAVLGVLFVTSEYSTGMIRTSLAAVPRRVRFLSAKLLVFGAVALVVSEILTVVSFFLGQSLLASGAPTAGIGDHNVARTVFGSGLYLTLLALVAVALGTLLRSTAGAITSIVALLFVLPAIAIALPTSIRQSIEKFWPTNAGQDITTVVPGDHTLSAWVGLGDMALFTAVVVVLAGVVLTKRDA